jgi:hypothetical protein
MTGWRKRQISDSVYTSLKPVMVVFCEACDGQHDTTKVKFLNIEEDIQGRDVMEFECPDVADSVVRSLVFQKRWSDT